MQQVIAPARLAVRAAKIEAAERLHIYESPGAFAVQVQIADMELVAGAFEMDAVIGVAYRRSARN